MRARLMVAFILFAGGWLLIEARAQNADGAASGLAYRIEKVVEGVYYATSNGTMNVGANSVILVNDDETFIIDSGITPAAGRALIAAVKTITTKPVRYVVNSHYHYDHAHGNQIFGPEVHVIGHDNTRHRMLTNIVEQDEPYVNNVRTSRARLETLKQQIASERDSRTKRELEHRTAVGQAYLDALRELKVTPPTTTFSGSMTLHRGNREIQILYLGRGHTDNDIVVYLPKERIVCTGDLMESVISSLASSYPEEWIVTLDNLKALDFDIIVPAHGTFFKGKDKINAFQRYLRDVLDQVNDFREQGLSIEEAAKRVDVMKYRTEFPSIREGGIDVRAVARIYGLAQVVRP